MYKVYCDGKTLYEPQNKELTIIDPVVELELNTAGSFTFTMPPEHPLYDAIDLMRSEIAVRQDDSDVFVGRPVNITTDMYNQKKVECEGELAFLGDSILRPAEYHNMTVRQYLETVIALHNQQVDESRQFEVGNVTVTDSNDSLYRYTNMQSTLTEIKEDLVDDLGGYLQVERVYNASGELTHRYLNYVTLDDYAGACSQHIDFGENLLDFTNNTDLTDIATAIIPLGATLEDENEFSALEIRQTIADANEGIDYLTIPEAVDKYGMITKTVTWDNVTTAETLKAKGEKWLTDYQYDEMIIEAKAIDLHYFTDEVERFKLGQMIYVESKPHGMARYFPLSKMSIYLTQPSNNTVTLGTMDDDPTLTGKTNEVSSGVVNLETIPIIPSSIQSAINALTASINGETTGIVRFIRDTEKENNYIKEIAIFSQECFDTGGKSGGVWRWNVNGLAYFSNGYNGDGRSATDVDSVGLTKDGLLIASEIFSKYIYGYEIAGTYIHGTETDSSGAYKFSVDEKGTLYAVSGTVGGFSLDTDSLTSNGLEIYVDTSEANSSAGHITEIAVGGIKDDSTGTVYFDGYKTQFGLFNYTNPSDYNDFASWAVGYAQLAGDNKLMGGLYLQPYTRGSGEESGTYVQEVLRLGYGEMTTEAVSGWGRPYFTIDGIASIPDSETEQPVISTWLQTHNTNTESTSLGNLVLAPRGRVYQRAMWCSPNNAWHNAAIAFRHYQYLRNSSSTEGTYPGYNLDTWAFRPCTECGYQSATAFQLGTTQYGWERLYMQPADNRNCGIWLNDPSHPSSYTGDRETYFMLGRIVDDDGTVYWTFGNTSTIMHYRVKSVNSNSTGLAFTISPQLISRTSDTTGSGNANVYLAGYASENGNFLRSYTIAGHRRSSSEAASSVYPVYVDSRGTLFRGTDAEVLSATSLSAAEQVEELKTQIEALESKQAEALEQIEKQEAVIEKLEAQAGVKLDL